MRAMAMSVTGAIGLMVSLFAAPVAAGQLSAGVAKVDITNYDAGPVNDPLFVKALVIREGETTGVIITVDAVAIGEIGYIKHDYLPKVRGALEQELKIPPGQVLVNASHCHGVVCADVAERTIQAVKKAAQNVVPVKVGAGVGHEDRIQENRRLRLKNGKELDIRRAYSLPPDEEIAGVGPIDPEIGLVRIDHMGGRPLAVIYNFACHPIQGVPSGGNTADYVAFSSKVLEEHLGNGALAFFLQGCGGDINPAKYKEVDVPRDAEPLGNMLGLSAMRALNDVESREDGAFKLLRETLKLPRADLAERIAELEEEQRRLANSLGGTDLNLKTFLQLAAKYNLAGEFPSYSAQRYLHDTALGRDNLPKLDAQNRKHLQAYVKNIHTMEELTRVKTNLALLKMHQAQNMAAGERTIEVELLGWRIGEFVLVTFPGELTVQIGKNIKEKSPHPLTFVAGYTNGYIYYAPTDEQLQNVGGAQEDSDCILAPGWQGLFEEKAEEMLRRL